MAFGDDVAQRAVGGTTEPVAPRRQVQRVQIPPKTPFRLDDYMLIVGSPRGRAVTPVDEYLDFYDAEHEDAWGRLPHEPGYGMAPVVELPTPAARPARQAA